ncbi:hypothetical protein DINM_000028 [Dirofilaria immitis]|nr:hypothetical protein [Dirofilaria immitis]
MVHQDPQFRYIDICVKAERAELKSKEDDGHRRLSMSMHVFDIFLLIFCFVSVTQACAPPEAGRRGQPGRNGRDGKQGVPGPQGIEGDVGEKGIQGLPGDSGWPGEEGNTGPKGEIGDEGLVGIRGQHVMMGG